MSDPRARVSPGLTTRVARRTPMVYARGADPAIDRPAHVRAGSAVALLASGRLAVIQDDAAFVALVDPETGRAADVPLPAYGGLRQFDDDRGNKADKLDLEACVVLRGGTRLVAFGSGSSARRERIVVVDGIDQATPMVNVVEAAAFYRALREAPEFSGSELNVEGVACAGGDLVLFQRGNGSGDAVDATARVSEAELFGYLEALSRGEAAAAPALRHIVAWRLGAVDVTGAAPRIADEGAGTRLTFTDGARTPRGRLAFLACAEDSPDATRDGPVTGVVIGQLDDAAPSCEVGWVLDEHGAPLVDKAEGLAFDPSNLGRAWAVVDKDDPRVPAELLELALGEGFSA